MLKMGNKQNKNHEQKRKLTLSYACKVGDINLARQAILRGATDYSEGFKFVCRYGHANLLPLILEDHILISRKDYATNILIATCYGHLDVVKYIYGINSTYVTNTDVLCISAVLCNHKNIVEWLLSLPNTNINFNACFLCTDVLILTFWHGQYSKQWILQPTI